MNHKAQAIIISCIDYRFQKYINDWISENFKDGTYDRGAFAGAGKYLYTVLNQVEVANKLHHIKNVILINHEDCGAYGDDGKPLKHALDLRKNTKVIMEKYPNLKIDTYYLRLDGVFEQVS